MKSIKDFFKKPFTAAITAALLVGAAWFLFSLRDDISSYEFMVAVRRDVVEEISVTGKVKPVQSAHLSFDGAGRVAVVYVGVGDTVSAGEVLAVLESSELLGSLQKAEADLEAQKAKLNKAEIQLAQYYENIPDVLRDAYTTAENSVLVKTSGIFSGYKTSSYSLTYTSCSESEDEAEFLRSASDVELEQWKSELTALGDDSSRDDALAALGAGTDHLSRIKEFLDHTALTLTTGCTIQDSAFDTYRTNIGTARSNVNSALTDIANLHGNILLQGAEINSQSASVSAYAASVKNIRAQLDNKAIRAPIHGTITAVDAKVGEVVSANTAVISLISASRFQVDVNIPEADIARVGVRDYASVTLDAYGRDIVFDALVVSIDPAETVIEGVPTYKAMLQFQKDDARIKSGMTANVDIFGEKRMNVLALPQRALIRNEKGVFVRVLKDESTGTVEEVWVETGLRSSDGYIEIVSGIYDGDKIITFEGK